MAVKGVCVVHEVRYVSASQFAVSISYAAVDAASLMDGTTLELASTVTNLQLEVAVRDAVKTVLENAGVVFGPLDTVRMIGAAF